MIKILKAGAGTGKTYRLSLEYVAALLQGESYGEIVVMTFTRKATAEIRERIFAHLEDLVHNGDQSEVWKNLQKIFPGLRLNRPLLAETYAAMLKNKDRLHIHTIDSFITRLFKQAVAPYLGVVHYEIIEEEKNSEIIEEVFKAMLDKADDFALMEKFLADTAERDIDRYLDLIRKMLDHRWVFLMVRRRPRAPRQVKNLPGCLEEILCYLQEAAAVKDGTLEEFLAKNFKTLIPEYLRLDSLKAKEDLIWKNRDLFFQSPPWNGNKLKSKDVDHLRTEMAAKYDEFRRQLAAWIYNREMIPYEEEIFNFSARIFALYDRLKFKTKLFTHQDISNYTYKYLYEESLALVNGEKVSAYFFELLGTRVKTVFIDEFQDTGILQWKILKPLLNKVENIIAVGDEKQSIYGWRGGEKELFARLDKILGGKSERLSTCYRSDKRIVAFVNSFFTRLAAETGWEYEPVEPPPGKKEGYVELLLGGEALRVRTDTRTFQNLPTGEQEAIKELNSRITVDLKREIAKRIKALPGYGATAVLARTGADLEAIAAELDKEGLPYLLESRESLLDHEAVQPLYFLLSYLAYQDYLSLVKFLRSDLGGINRRDLKHLFTHKPAIERFLMGEKEAPLPPVPGLKSALGLVRDLRGEAWEELPHLLLARSGIIGLYQENSGALKNLFRFYVLMRNHSSLRDFLNYVEENKNSDRLKQVGVQQENTVQLMTVHKAKGLSFETVFFYWKPSARRGGGSRNMKLFVRFDEDFTEIKDYLLTNGRYLKYLPCLGYDFAEEEKSKELEEEINILYVAVTRPESNLFLYIEGPRQLQPDNPGADWQESKEYGFYEPALLAAAGVESLAALTARKELGSLHVEVKAKSEAQTALPPLRPFFTPARPPAAEVERINRNKEFGTTLEQQKKRIAGLAAHYYLEHIKYNTPEERAYARRMVLAGYGNILGAERIKDLVSRVENFLASRPDLFDRCRRVFTEYEIEDGGQRYRIDRLLVDEEKKELLILDFKTGETMDESQLEEYRRVLEAKTGGRYQVKTGFIEL